MEYESLNKILKQFRALLTILLFFVTALGSLNIFAVTRDKDSLDYFKDIYRLPFPLNSLYVLTALSNSSFG